MSKRCKQCGAVVESSARFCQMCGCNEFFAEAQPQQTENNYNPNMAYNQGQYQPPVPQKNNSNRKWIIAGIVLVVLSLLATVGYIAEKTYQNRDNSSYNSNSSSTVSFSIGISNSSESNTYTESSDSADYAESVDTTSEYTKGTFDGTVYKNEWSGIKLEMPDTFEDAPQSVYNEVSTAPNTEYGIYLISSKTSSLMYIAYEKLPDGYDDYYDEEKYLDASMNYLNSLTTAEYKTTDNYTSINIAGYEYKKAECSFTQNGIEFANTLYVRKIDNYIEMISVGIPGADSDCDPLASKVESYN